MRVIEYVHFVWNSPCGVMFGATIKTTHLCMMQTNRWFFSTLLGDGFRGDFVEEMNQVNNKSLNDFRRILMEYVESKMLARKQQEVTGIECFFMINFFFHF